METPLRQAPGPGSARARSRARRAGSALLLAACALAAVAPPGRAGIEPVTVRTAAADSVDLQRDDGGLWRVWRSNDSLSVWAWMGRRLLVFSPGPFLGTGARLLLPEWDQQARVVRARFVARGQPVTPAMDAETEAGLRAMREALEMLGYDCGGTIQPGFGEKARVAFIDYRQKRGLDLNDYTLPRAVIALGLDVMGATRGSGSSQRISRALSDHKDAVVTHLSSGSGGGVESSCDIPTPIRKFSEQRDLVTLGDGTRWSLPATAPVQDWQPSDSVVVCQQRLINLRTGVMVHPARAK